MRKLVIIDGKSVFYRGYYAMGKLTTSAGVPTGGVYGFAAIAMELVRELKPDKVVVAWDKAKTSIRKRREIYAGYKAGRIKPPEDFYVQIPLLKDLTVALGWAFVECDDYEADDIIGTLARQADEEVDETGKCVWETVIISSDLDMLQIVDENTRMYRLLKGFSRLEEMDVAAVERKYGIKKRQFLDLKALKGDASDRIPGVSGIGEKTAVKLLNQYGTVEGVYAHLAEIEPESLRKKLRLGEEAAKMSWVLAKIMTDAPVELADLPDLTVDSEKILRELEKLEFRSLERKFGEELRELSENVEKTPENGKNSEKMPENSENLAKKTGISSKTQKNSPKWLFSDVKSQMHRDEKIAAAILSGEEYWDLGQARFLLNPLLRRDERGELSLEVTLEQREAEWATQVREFKDYPKLERIFLEFDLPLVPVLYKMEKTGLKISGEYFARLIPEMTDKVGKLEEEVYELAKERFNVNSPAQLAKVLFEDLGLPTKGVKKTVRGYSTNAAILEKLAEDHAVVAKVLEYRKAAKLLSTYVSPLPALADSNGRIHTTFTQNVTATGRLSSLNPNLQNIPVRTEEGRKIRQGFIADEGKRLVVADYAQFELRLAAALAGDENLIADFNAGVDIHVKTAAEVFGASPEAVTKAQRQVAKTVNFGVLYGMGTARLAAATGMSSGEAKQFIAEYNQLRRPLMDYLDQVLESARRMGFVETFYGRRRPAVDIWSANGAARAAAERAVRNMPIQGTEADLMKRAMIRVDRKLPAGADLVLQIHDSLMVECEAAQVDEVAGILRYEMEAVAPELPVKLAVEVKSGENWGEV